MLKFIAPTVAWLRHVGTGVASAVAVLGVLAGLSPDDQAKLLDAVRHFVDGATNMLTAFGTIAAIAMAVWARWTAKPEQQVAAVKAMPNADVVPVDPEKSLTAGAPGATVKSHWLVGLVAMSVAGLLLLGCGGTQQERQEDADQIFGKAKVGYVALSGLVSAYNLMLPCSDNGLPPPLCYSAAVGDIANKVVAGLADGIASAEKIFAAANSTPGAKLDAARAIFAALQEALANLAKYGVTTGGG